MDGHMALRTFLAGALGRRRDRYLDFIAKPKTQAKFLNAICHDLETDLDPSRQIAELPPGSAPIPGYRFAPPDEFGSPVRDIREVCRSQDDGFLVVSEDGQFGIHGPETFLDDRAIYRVKPSRSNGAI